MRPEHPQQRLEQRAELVGPGRRVVDVDVNLGPDPLRQPVEQLVLAVEMPVQGHRGDAELLRELADRQRVQPDGIGEPHRPVNDGRPGQPGALAVATGRFCVVAELR